VSQPGKPTRAEPARQASKPSQGNASRASQARQRNASRASQVHPIARSELFSLEWRQTTSSPASARSTPPGTDLKLQLLLHSWFSPTRSAPGGMGPPQLIHDPHHRPIDSAPRLLRSSLLRAVGNRHPPRNLSRPAVAASDRCPHDERQSRVSRCAHDVIRTAPAPAADSATCATRHRSAAYAPHRNQ